MALNFTRGAAATTAEVSRLQKLKDGGGMQAKNRRWVANDTPPDNNLGLKRFIPLFLCRNQPAAGPQAGQTIGW